MKPPQLNKERVLDVLGKLKNRGILKKDRIRELFMAAHAGRLENEDVSMLLELNLLLDIPDRLHPECPDCNVPLDVRNGKFGFFWGCPNYFGKQNCRVTKNIEWQVLKKRDPQWAQALYVAGPTSVPEAKKVEPKKVEPVSRVKTAKFGRFFGRE